MVADPGKRHEIRECTSLHGPCAGPNAGVEVFPQLRRSPRQRHINCSARADAPLTVRYSPERLLVEFEPSIPWSQVKEKLRVNLIIGLMMGQFRRLRPR